MSEHGEIRDAVRAVLEAARAWHPTDFETKAVSIALHKAVEALEALTPPWEDVAEMPLPWGKVIAGDEALGANGKWYRVAAVTSSGRPGDPVSVDIEINGVTKRYQRDAAIETKVRRKASEAARVLALMDAAGLDPWTLISKEA